MRLDLDILYFIHLMNNVMHHIALYNKVTSRKIATFYYRLSINSQIMLQFAPTE